MLDEAAFLRQIDRYPEDLATLQVYADWLEENTQDDRAGFLRLQMQILALMPRVRGLIGLSRQLVERARRLPRDWVSLVSRPRLVDTCWAGHDSDGSFYVFRYLPGGTLNYTSPSGKFQNGTWIQVGNQVLMEMNRHYADYEGFVCGSFIRGTATNILGNHWRWRVNQTADPELCDPGDAIMTIFAEHQSRRRSRSRRATRARRHRRSGPGR
ncbi:MAG: TIGR02996 domain-containing protein [Gemmataceae bacterium]